MQFTGFDKQDFDVFRISGLEDRMTAIQRRIQPKFKAIGSVLVDHLSTTLGQEMFIHIAKHARRTVNPPNDTWIAFSSNKRGYKKHPHFQVGLWDDRVFVWLAYIYELPNKQDFADRFLNHEDELITMIPSDFELSTNHMKKSHILMEEDELRHCLERFRSVKSSELLIGKQFAANDPLLEDGEAFIEEVIAIFDKLISIYKFSLNS